MKITRELTTREFVQKRYEIALRVYVALLGDEKNQETFYKNEKERKNLMYLSVNAAEEFISEAGYLLKVKRTKNPELKEMLEK